MQFFRKFWERLFKKRSEEINLIGRDAAYYESFYGKENELLSSKGKEEYYSKVYDTDKYFIQLIFSKNIAIAKNYIDKLGSINFAELQNLVRNNFRSFEIKFIGYNLSSNQTVQINTDQGKAMILNHPKIIPLGNGGFVGVYPLRSVLFIIDPQMLQFLIKAFRSGKRF